MSLHFSGSTILDVGKLNDTILSDGTAFSMSCWIYPQGWGPGNAGRIFERGILLAFIRFQNSGVLQFAIKGTTSLVRTTQPTIPQNAWSHVAFTWNGTTVSDQSHFYVSGIEPAYQAGTNGVSLTDNSASILYIGNTSALNAGFHGFISELACWNGVLNNSEIYLLANSKMRGMPLQIQPEKLQCYYPLDQAGIGQKLLPANRLIDYSNFANHATPSGNISGAADYILSYHG